MKNKIIYWVATGLLAIGMLQSGIFSIMRTKEWVDLATGLGYPAYFLTLIGIWKILGVIVILIPGFKLFKEWAYAGFFFLMTGAIFSHFAVGDGAMEYFGPTLLLLLAFLSWYFRPTDRKVS